MKKCPFCAEEIQDAAIFCKHCRRDLPPPAPSGTPSATPAWESEARALIREGKSIHAIKRIREATDLGLKEAKDLADTWARGEEANAAATAGASGPAVGMTSPNSTKNLSGAQSCGGCLAALLVIGGLALVGNMFGKGTTEVGAPTQPASRPKAETVSVSRLLSDYGGNEVAADARYKGKRIRVTGIVGDIKKDILDQPYITLGQGREFEIPVVQCMLASSAAGRAAQASKGQTVTLEGTVDGLLMNVIMRNCTF